MAWPNSFEYNTLGAYVYVEEVISDKSSEANFGVFIGDRTLASIGAVPASNQNAVREATKPISDEMNYFNANELRAIAYFMLALVNDS